MNGGTGFGDLHVFLQETFTMFILLPNQAFLDCALGKLSNSGIQIQVDS